MRSLVLVLLLALPLGCKRNAKPTGKADDTASAKPAPSPEDRAKVITKDRGTDGEKPNWLNDPRYKKTKEPPPPQEGGIPGKPGWGITGAPDGGWNPANPPAVPANPGPAGAPAAPPVPPMPPANPTVPPAGGPAGKMVTRDDLNEVWVFVDNFSGASGKMPPPEVIFAALVEAKAKSADLVKGGYIVLTGAKTRETVWAYEKDAPVRGGWIASQNGPEQVTAQQFAQRFGR